MESYCSTDVLFALAERLFPASPGHRGRVFCVLGRNRIVLSGEIDYNGWWMSETEAKSTLGMQIRNRWLLIASLVGFAVHVAFCFTSGTLAQVIADRVAERMWTEPGFEVGYEMWEAPWVHTLLTLGVPFCIYLPAGFLAILATLVYVFKRTPEIGCRQLAMIALQVAGVWLGIFTLIYFLTSFSMH